MNLEGCSSLDTASLNLKGCASLATGSLNLGGCSVAGSLNLCPLPTLGLSTTSCSAAGAGLDLTSLTASGRLFEPPEFLGMLFLVR